MTSESSPRTAADPIVTRPHPRFRVETTGPVMRVVLDAPHIRNAQVPSMWLALADVARSVPPEIRVVILEGEGPAFSAGLDRGLLTGVGVEGETHLLSMAHHGPESLADHIADFQAGFTAWQECPALVVAAVHGPAYGAGFQLALAADMRVVATDVAFVMAEVTLGLVPDLAGTASLASLVGPSRALEICLTGRPVGAEEAVATGLASLAVEPGELRQTVDDLVEAVLAAPPEAGAEIVQLFRGITDRSPAEQQRREREAQARRICALAERFGHPRS